MRKSFVSFLIFTLFLRSTLSNEKFPVEHPLLQTLTQYELATVQQFENHDLTKKKPEITTELLHLSGAHTPNAHFTINFEGKYYNIDLYRNEELLPDTFKTTSFNNFGKEFTSKPTNIEKSHHCYYQGYVRNIPESQVIASTCNGLRGCIILPDDFLVIEPLHKNASVFGYVVYRPKHVKQTSVGTCGNHNNQIPDLLQQFDAYANLMNNTIQSRKKRQSSNERKFVELLMVADSLEVRNYPDRQDLNDRIKELVNYVDGFYQKLGIRVVLSGIEAWRNTDRTTITNDAQQALDSFLNYREQRRATDPATSPWTYSDNVHLLYGGDFRGSTIGMATVGTMCGRRSGGVNQDHSSNVINTAATVAHEMGHNFGMQHDTAACVCPRNAECIMAASSTGFAPTRAWSSCSEAYLNQNLKMGVGSCLLNVPDPSQIFGGPRCGNEIVEEGEECDCGQPGFCTSSCCNPSTCQLLPNAQCDAGLCCNNCNLVAAGTLCRGAGNDECELSEYCTGKSAYCPDNVYKEDGTLCLQNTATCYEGICLTHTMQCQNIWGSSASNGDDLCYVNVNANGNSNGNCGKDDQGNYIPCLEENAKCGKLQCSGGASRPLIGSDRTSYRNRITFGRRTVECRTLGSEATDVSDPGLVRSGTMCDVGKVCSTGVCQTIPNLTCSNKCNGNGVCNNLGNCHCNRGFAPPFCAAQGNGGSTDSGPIEVIPTTSPTRRTTTRRTTTRRTTTRRTTTRRTTTRRTTTRRTTTRPTTTIPSFPFFPFTFFRTTTRRTTTRRTTTRRTTTRPTTTRPTTTRPTTTRRTTTRPTTTLIRRSTTRKPITVKTTSASTFESTTTPSFNNSGSVEDQIDQVPITLIAVIVLVAIVLLVAAVLFTWCRFFGGKSSFQSCTSKRETRSNAIPSSRPPRPEIKPAISMSRENLIFGSNSAVNLTPTHFSAKYSSDSSRSSMDYSLPSIEESATPYPTPSAPPASFNNSPQLPRSKPPIRPATKPSVPPPNLYSSPSSLPVQPVAPSTKPSPFTKPKLPPIKPTSKPTALPHQPNVGVSSSQPYQRPPSLPNNKPIVTVAKPSAPVEARRKAPSPPRGNSPRSQQPKLKPPPIMPSKPKSNPLATPPKPTSTSGPSTSVLERARMFNKT